MSKDFEDADIRRVGDATGGVDRVLRDVLTEPCVVSLLDFGGNSDGATDNHQAFMDAAEYVFSKGGGTIYVPPITSGSYKLFSPFNPGDCTNETPHKPLSIVGEGSAGGYGSFISGSFEGGLFEQTFGTNNNFRLIYGLKMDNTHALGRALKIAQCQSCVIENCTLSGKLYGIEAVGETYHLHVNSCGIASNGGGHVGVYGAQMSMTLTRVTGWHAGSIFFNVGVGIKDCSFEANRTGLHLGLKSEAVFTATSSGTDLTVTEVHEGTIVPGFLVGDYSIPMREARITGQTSGTTGGVGVYTTNNATYCDDSVVIVFSGSALGGFTMSGCSFEQNNCGIDLYSCAGGLISSCGITGTVGPVQLVSSLSWSAGTVTVTTTQSHDQSGTFLGYLGTYPDSAWEVSNVTMTVTGANTFTYALVGDPGSTSGLSELIWMRNIDYGLRVRNASQVTIAGVGVGIEHIGIAGIDLYWEALTAISRVTFINTSSGGALDGGGVHWLPPVIDGRQAYKLINCNYQMVMPFAYLPTGGDDWHQSVGAEYIISDGREAGAPSTTSVPAMGAAVTQGGGTYTQKIRVMWNEVDWVRTG